MSLIPTIKECVEYNNVMLDPVTNSLRSIQIHYRCEVLYQQNEPNVHDIMSTWLLGHSDTGNSTTQGQFYVSMNEEGHRR